MLVDEFGGYMMVAIVIIGIADTWEAKGHIAIDTFTKRMPTRLRNWVRFVTFAMATLLAPVLIITSIQLVIYSHKYGVRNESWLRTPLKWPQLVLIIGFILLLLQQIISLIGSTEVLKTRKGGRDKWNHK
jgi:TRAP-type C4-dicarboxylate transport system permease small subunit